MITIRKPNDFHHHLREKELLQLTVKSCFDKFHYVVVMPNLKKPITTIKEALEYRKTILSVDEKGKLKKSKLRRKKSSNSNMED